MSGPHMPSQRAVANCISDGLIPTADELRHGLRPPGSRWQTFGGAGGGRRNEECTGCASLVAAVVSAVSAGGGWARRCNEEPQAK